jgi:hypothetical protein
VNREVGFELRYAIEQAANAFRAFSAAWDEAEAAGRRRRERESSERGDAYQQWREARVLGSGAGGEQ